MHLTKVRDLLKVEEQLPAPEVEDFLKLYRCKSNDVLLADWSGILYADRARAGCTAILDTLRAHPFPKILNNNIKVTGHYPGAIEWVGKVWFPGMYALGTRHFAWVYSPAFYTQISTDEIVKLSSKVEIQTFYDIEDACQWLLATPSPGE
ncbi:hypothetical protein [Pontibacter fetidus]|uniref:STAS/SEC14 domain-containing protein n=1 Tax=Pontibacter fetidus TaxID=2700082 RepID=A0A6B2H5K8_9BACT|nr:hypothetical protein [Pontibacter fetidus]NDK54402.1 hypothetical protein [Pontibacter fetidus]